MHTGPFALPLEQRIHAALLHAYTDNGMPTSELGLHFNLSLAQIKQWLDHPQTQQDITLLHELIARRAADSRPHLTEQAIQTLHQLSLIGPGSKQTTEEIRQGEASRKATHALLRAIKPIKQAQAVSTPVPGPSTKNRQKSSGIPATTPLPHPAPDSHGPTPKPLVLRVQSPFSTTQQGQTTSQPQEARAHHALPDRPDTRPQTRIMGRERERPRHRFPDPEPAVVHTPC